MENKNTIIAILLMLAVWIGFSILFPSGKLHDMQPDNVPVETQQGPVVSPSVPLKDKGTLNDLIDSKPSLEPQDGEIIKVETDKFTVSINTVGATLERFDLKDFSETPDKDSLPVSLVKPIPKSKGTLLLEGHEGFRLASLYPYNLVGESKVINISAGETRNIVFQTKTLQGIVIDKTYVFSGDRYGFDVKIKISNMSQEPLQGSLSLTEKNYWDSSMSENSYEFNGPVTLVGEEIEQVKVDDLEKGLKKYGSDAVWSAFETKYFIKACVPYKSSLGSITVDKTENLVRNIFNTANFTLNPGDAAEIGYFLYWGPRDLDLLKQAGYQLDKAIDFGFFSILALPLLHVLKLFYGFLGNYGFSIILLTVIIKVLFWPLTQKSYSSMKAMQKLQPEMQKLRERFKNDRERMNREIMELYKKHRVNPMGGCLPMLVQIPVFFALYKVLLDAIELRHAPFAFWITDLSAKDPYYITPLIMGVTMFLQQKMSPSTMDPAQARIFMIMPVVFTFLFLNFPSGLVIYWLVNNILTIVQQYFINRKPAH